MFRRLGFLFCFLFACAQSEAFSSEAKQAFLMDGATGEVLYEKNAYEKMTPSSMSKLMTLYITFERLKGGSVKLQDNMLVSKQAWRMGGSKMFLSPDTSVSVEDLLRGVIVQSGNDACIVLAEGLAGSEKDFASLMNAKAAELGLKNTHFINATGMPDKEHYMSAEDIAYLSVRIMEDFHEYYHYFSEKEFTFNNIKQPNRNNLLSVGGVDGLKTGHTEVGKYGVSVSAIKDGRRLIAVVNGTRNEKERASEAQKLLQYGFLNFENVIISDKNTNLGEIPVHLGVLEKVKFSTTKPVVFTIPITKKGQTEVKVKYLSAISAPISKGTKIGEVYVKLHDGREYSFDLYPSQDVEKLGFFKRSFIAIKSWIKNFSFKEPISIEEIRSFVV
jgi:D-alanyl-D-alanine carboxypeptidase (penicillin-binding protein 5/6)